MARFTIAVQPPRERWRVEMVEQRSSRGLVHFEYVIRDGPGEPFLLNNHRAQLRAAQGEAQEAKRGMWADGCR